MSTSKATDRAVYSFTMQKVSADMLTDYVIIFCGQMSSVVAERKSSVIYKLPYTEDTSAQYCVNPTPQLLPYITVCPSYALVVGGPGHRIV